MKHHIVYSRYIRNGRSEVLVLRDEGQQEIMHLHPGGNAVDADVWAKVKDLEPCKGLLASKVLEDRGEAPEVVEAEETTAPESPKAKGTATPPLPETTPAPDAPPSEK